MRGLSWQDRARCAGAGLELFFPDGGDTRRAKAFCAGCPVKDDCLDGALTRREPWGVWGGELFVQGAVVARKRPRGRPRKSDTVTAA